MKNIIWIFTFVFFIKYFRCNEGILSKFHQNGYKLRNTRFQLMSYDEESFNFFEIKAFKYNRTTTAHNGTFNTKVAVGDKVEIIIQANRFLSNEYRHFPIRFQTNLKKAFDMNAIGLGALKNCGNLTDFYIYKDITYYACNFVIDETRFPPLIPDGKYRVGITLSYLKKEIALIYFFTEIYTPITPPKQ